MLMAEQNFNQAIRIADRGYVIVHGKIAFAGNSAERTQQQRPDPEVLSGALVLAACGDFRVRMTFSKTGSTFRDHAVVCRMQNTASLISTDVDFTRDGLQTGNAAHPAFAQPLGLRLHSGADRGGQARRAGRPSCSPAPTTATNTRVRSR